MDKKQLIHQNLLIIGSFLTLVGVLCYFWFSSHEINIKEIFPNVRQGTVSVDAPKSAVVTAPFSVKLTIDSSNQNVNAAGIYIRFDPKYLRLLDLDTSQSFCQFYPEKRFDNNIGTVSLACGSPHPGVSGKNTLLVLKFMPTAIGATLITIDPKSQILLSNGKGTNIMTEFPQEKINIVSGI